MSEDKHIGDELLKGEGDTKTVVITKKRQECKACGNPATAKHTFLYIGARSNPASSGYGKDNISWCEDECVFTCGACKKVLRRPQDDNMEWAGTFQCGERFSRMFLYEDTVDAPDLTTLRAENERLLMLALDRLTGWNAANKDRITLQARIDELEAVLWGIRDNSTDPKASGIANEALGEQTTKITTLTAKLTRLRVTLDKIANHYATTNELSEESEDEYGLAYSEALEMAYENIQCEARTALAELDEPEKGGE